MNDQLRGMSLRQLLQLFATLPVPDVAMRHGFFRASFVGPAWYRLGGFPSVHLAGLPHWQGKKFLSADRATNVLKRGAGTVDALAMTVEPGTSLVDGQPGVALRYGKEAPVPWRFVRDELRAVDARTLLGVTIVDLPVLRWFRFPFLLERE